MPKSINTMIMPEYEVDQDHENAEERWKLAAKQGHAGAQLNYGLVLESRGFKENDAAQRAKYYAKAAKQYESAVNQGHAGAQCTLGVMYANGRGVVQDDVKAVELFRLADEQQHPWAYARLYDMLEDDRGIPQYDAEAIKKYRYQAQQGDAKAQRILDKLDVLEEIDEILDGFKLKIYEIGQHHPKAKDNAEKLFTELKIARNRYAIDVNIQEEQMRFKATCANAIEHVKPSLEKDLGWGGILANLLKALVNAVVFVATLGKRSAFFPYTRSEAVQEVEGLENKLNNSFIKPQ